MTSKDYVRIARAMADTYLYPDGTDPVESATYATWCAIQANLSLELADDNPRFDRDRFFAACRGDKEGGAT